MARRRQGPAAVRPWRGFLFPPLSSAEPGGALAGAMGRPHGRSASGVNSWVQNGATGKTRDNQ